MLRWAFILLLTVSCGAPTSRPFRLAGAAADVDPNDDPSEPPVATGPAVVAASALPRLARREIDAVLLDVLGIDNAAGTYLPPDADLAVDGLTGIEREVFDTLAASKTASQVFVEGQESLAFNVAAQVGADAAKIEQLAGCAPASAWDAGCFAQFVDRVAPRLWRRPLDSDERAALLAMGDSFGVEAGQAIAIRAALASMLQSPAFSYRVEIGASDGSGLMRLNNYELVTRLSTTLWGAAPSAELFDSAAGVDFTDDDVAALAANMLTDARADQQLRRFHQLWLRADQPLVQDAELASDMRAESNALLDSVLFDVDGAGVSPWTTLFDSRRTFVTPRLAQHYGLPTIPTQAQWVSYADDDARAGVLSHGSFLSRSSTHQTDTLPSRRGAMVARRFLCAQIAPPPPNVNIDNGVPALPGACKPERYAAHASGSCQSCHTTIDAIGFGLEQYDGQGRFRDVEPDNAACAFTGDGSVEGTAFHGPRALGDWLVSTGRIGSCGVEQLLRFAHRTEAGARNGALNTRLRDGFAASNYDMRALLLALVTDAGFRLRKEEAP